jgi:hypothetical protein
MKRASILIFIIIIGISAFISGYWYRLNEFTQDAEIEDYALTNILLTVSNKRFMNNFDSTEFKKETDMNLDMHLNRVRKSYAYKDNAKLAEARVVALNMAYCYWNASPPFFPSDFGGTQIWADEWRKNHTKNLDLISHAHQEWVRRGGEKCP